MQNLSIRERAELQIKLEISRRTVSASIGYMVAGILLIFFPIVTSPEFVFPQKIAAAALFTTSLLRFLFVRKYLNTHEIFDGLKEKYRIKSVLTHLNSLAQSAIFCLVYGDPNLSQFDFIMSCIFISSVAAASLGSIAMDQRLEFFFLLCVVEAPSITYWYLQAENKMYAGIYPVLMTIHFIWMMRNAKFFYKTTRKRYESEEALKIEKSNLHQAIDDLKSAQNELLLQKAKAEHSAKLASLGEMAGGIAHEINNPLMVIQAQAEILAIKIEKTEHAEVPYFIEKTQKISSAVSRINKIINGLRSFSRDGEKEELHSVLVLPLVEDTLELCRQRFKNANIELLVEGLQNDVQIMCRSVQISQVLLNFLNNAFDAVEKSEKKEVRIRFYIDKKFMHILVEDSGPGVPIEMQQKIFEPFYTTKEPGKGTGLGLSIAKSIIESHLGQLTLEKSALGGACFHFSVPLTKEASH